MVAFSINCLKTTIFIMQLIIANTSVLHRGSECYQPVSAGPNFVLFLIIIVQGRLPLRTFDNQRDYYQHY
jgi:hypothetical protein